MLILERRPTQTVVIKNPTGGEPIYITVMSALPGRVKLGFDAPKDIEIHREEVFERIAAGK